MNPRVAPGKHRNHGITDCSQRHLFGNTGDIRRVSITEVRGRATQRDIEDARTRTAYVIPCQEGICFIIHGNEHIRIEPRHGTLRLRYSLAGAVPGRRRVDTKIVPLHGKRTPVAVERLPHAAIHLAGPRGVRRRRVKHKDPWFGRIEKSEEHNEGDQEAADQEVFPEVCHSSPSHFHHGIEA